MEKDRQISYRGIDGWRDTQRDNRGIDGWIEPFFKDYGVY